MKRLCSPIHMLLAAKPLVPLLESLKGDLDSPAGVGKSGSGAGNWWRGVWGKAPSLANPGHLQAPLSPLTSVTCKRKKEAQSICSKWYTGSWPAASDPPWPSCACGRIGGRNRRPLQVMGVRGKSPPTPTLTTCDARVWSLQSLSSTSPPSLELLFRKSILVQPLECGFQHHAALISE